MKLQQRLPASSRRYWSKLNVKPVFVTTVFVAALAATLATPHVHARPPQVSITTHPQTLLLSPFPLPPFPPSINLCFPLIARTRPRTEQGDTREHSRQPPRQAYTPRGPGGLACHGGRSRGSPSGPSGIPAVVAARGMKAAACLRGVGWCVVYQYEGT